MKISRGKVVFWVIAVMLVIDQVTKILVKTGMTLGESIPVLGNWFQICFVENNGMAFGLSFGESIGKFLLTAFRIVLAGFIMHWILKLIKAGEKTGPLVGLSLIFVGAVGNILDSLFYGLLFGPSTPYQVAEFLPEGGGYAAMMFGKVVDMLYFPLIEADWPQWVPFVGGEHFIFFSPVFNVADSCVTVGMLYLLIFQSKFIRRVMK